MPPDGRLHGHRRADNLGEHPPRLPALPRLDRERRQPRLHSDKTTCGEGRDCHAATGAYSPSTAVHDGSAGPADGTDAAHHTAGTAQATRALRRPGHRAEDRLQRVPQRGSGHGARAPGRTHSTAARAPPARAATTPTHRLRARQVGLGGEEHREGLLGMSDVRRQAGDPRLDRALARRRRAGGRLAPSRPAPARAGAATRRSTCGFCTERVGLHHNGLPQASSGDMLGSRHRQLRWQQPRRGLSRGLLRRPALREPHG